MGDPLSPETKCRQCHLRSHRRAVGRSYDGLVITTALQDCALCLFTALHFICMHVPQICLAYPFPFFDSIKAGPLLVLYCYCCSFFVVLTLFMITRSRSSFLIVFLPISSWLILSTGLLGCFHITHSPAPLNFCFRLIHIPHDQNLHHLYMSA